MWVDLEGGQTSHIYKCLQGVFLQYITITTVAPVLFFPHVRGFSCILYCVCLSIDSQSLSSTN